MGCAPVKLRDPVPEPLLSAPIHFKDGEDEITYKDCFESSIYRFLHLALAKKGTIDKESLLKLMDGESSHCQKLIAFLEKYSKVHIER